MRLLAKLDNRLTTQLITMANKLMEDASPSGLNVEKIKDAIDPSIRSIRVNDKYRVIAAVQGSTMIIVHIGEHDEAYRWARGRRLNYDHTLGRLRIVESVIEQFNTKYESFSGKEPNQPGVFDCFTDEELRSLGFGEGEIIRTRLIVNESQLFKIADSFDSTSFDILCALQSGYSIESTKAMLTGSAKKPDTATTIEEIVHTGSGKATIFVPKSEEELRRVLEGDLQEWRIFLHPEQRRIVDRDYNGPALVRGGAGTGKTVVAMHRANYLADRVAKQQNTVGQRVLLTTFTRNLALDIRENLKFLCPHHMIGNNPRIEVKNLDAWVTHFLKQRKFARTIVFKESEDSTAKIWTEVFETIPLPEDISHDFVKNEWRQVIQAQGIADRRDYFKASRAGRGTQLDRRNRAELWPIFEAVRARMLDLGLAEPEDAYREAATLLRATETCLPYWAIVVDEAQDIGEQAFKLISAMAAKTTDQRNALFIVGDAHQRIYRRKASMKSCGINVVGRSHRLRLNYRTSEPIRTWAVSILEGMPVDDMNDGLDSLDGYRSLVSGPAPECTGSISAKAEFTKIAEQITELPDTYSKCVLTRTNKIANKVADALRSHAIAVNMLTNEPDVADDVSSVRVSTMHRAKGLEFDAVFLACMQDGHVPHPSTVKNAVDPAGRRELLDLEKRLIHVAATRAKSRLFVSWSGQPSKLITPN